jgi:hypothetical protein
MLKAPGSLNAVCEIPECRDKTEHGWSICRLHVRRYWNELATYNKIRERRLKKQRRKTAHLDPWLDAPLIPPVQIPREYQQSWDDDRKQYVIIKRNKME